MSRLSLIFRGVCSARAGLPRLSGALSALGLAGCLLGAGACVEQTDDKPTDEDMEVIKKNLLAAPPAPKFPVNADLDGKVTYLGLDASAEPDRAGQRVQADPLLEGGHRLPGRAGVCSRTSTAPTTSSSSTSTTAR